MKSLSGALDLAIKRALEHVGKKSNTNDWKLLQTVKIAILLVMTVSHWQESIIKPCFHPLFSLLNPPIICRC